MARTQTTPWDHGYVTDVAYTTQFFRETTPGWIATAALLLGHRPPDLSVPFRYADLGCGNGIGALVVAATCPQAEVWGFDFNPAHIEQATALAARAGLPNAKFAEASFAELAAMPPGALPAFDFIISHGVLSWISPENRQQLIQVIGTRLRPGGLAYISYNVATGWAAMAPVQTLMRLLAQAGASRSDQGVPGILDSLDRLRETGARLFAGNAALEGRVKDLRRHDARYIAHEYLNRDWHPLMFADVSEAMAVAKCSYIGSATLADNIDGLCVPPGMAPMLAEARDQVTRETLRDIGCAQGFRRDLYRRGVNPVPGAELQTLMDELTIAWTGLVPPDPVTFATALGTVTGRAEIYRPLLDALREAPLSMRQARQLPALAGHPLVQLVQAITMLISGGYAHPMLPGGEAAEARTGTQALNRAIAALNAGGADLRHAVAPLIGSALGMDVLETLLLAALAEAPETPDETLVDQLLNALVRTGRGVQREGQAVADAGEARGVVRDLIRGFRNDKLPVLRRLGMV
jgi:SAM-dependent methyltransferase